MKIWKYILGSIILLLATFSLYTLFVQIIDNKKFNATSFEAKKDRLPIIKIKDTVLLDAPTIKQFPELPRGCEVTSLAMLLQYKGINVGKMELAEKIPKDTTPLIKEGSNISWGHPTDGFIGDMYSYNNPGYGVYHLPIKKLAEEYMPGKVVDLTGSEFNELKTYLSLGSPVWVITNATYNSLPDSAFETWQTPRGDLNVTYRLHSVLITGYDDKYVYFNDPLNGEKNKKVSTDNFIAAWEQLGSQAVTYY